MSPARGATPRPTCRRALKSDCSAFPSSWGLLRAGPPTRATDTGHRHGAWPRARGRAGRSADVWGRAARRRKCGGLGENRTAAPADVPEPQRPPVGVAGCPMRPACEGHRDGPAGCLRVMGRKAACTAGKVHPPGLPFGGGPADAMRDRQPRSARRGSGRWQGRRGTWQCPGPSSLIPTAQERPAASDNPRSKPGRQAPRATPTDAASLTDRTGSGNSITRPAIAASCAASPMATARAPSSSDTSGKPSPPRTRSRKRLCW